MIRIIQVMFFAAFMVTVLSPASLFAKPKKSAVMALLKQFSPEGYTVVSAYDSLPEKFTIDGATFNMKKRYDLMSFFPDDDEENFLQYMETGVHEINHLYVSWMGWKMQEDQGLSLGKGADAIQVKGKPYLVIRTQTFPSAEMDASMPKGGKTDRYSTYIWPSQSDQSTQSEGIYGLLDEFNAYRTGARTTLDFWPWVKEQGKNEKVLSAYVSLLYDAKFSYQEFRLFILHYLVFAKSDNTEVYDAVTGNASFVKAFLASEKEYAKIQKEIDAVIQEIIAFCEANDIEAEEQGGMFAIGDSGVGTFSKERKAVEKVLAKPEYVEMMRALTGK